MFGDDQERILSDVYDAAERSKRILASLLTDRNVRAVALRVQQVLREKHNILQSPPPLATMRRFITQHYRSILARTPDLPSYILGTMANILSHVSDVDIRNYVQQLATKAADFMAAHHHMQRQYKKDLRHHAPISSRPAYVVKKTSNPTRPPAP